MKPGLVSLFLSLLLVALGSTPHDAYPGDRTKVLRICDLANDASLRLDPHRQFDERNDNVLSQIFEHLLEFDVDGNPRPNLARRWKRLDEYTVEFELHRNLFFQNGEPCNARAVKFSLERNLDPGLKSPSYHIVESIKRVDVIDDHRFKIITKYPDGILLRRLAQFGYIVPPSYIHMVGDKGFESHPIGTGPFTFVRWTKGKELVLERNQRYWRKGLPHVDRIVFKFASARKRADMLMQGRLDLITNFEPTDLDRIRRKDLKVIKEPSFTMMSINFNLIKKNTPFRDKRVRRALNYAVDVDDLIRKVRLGNGMRRATLGMPGEFGYNPYIKPYPHDPDKARALLVEAGLGEGFKATLMIDDIDGGADSALGAELKKQLAQVGIRLEVQGGNGALRIVNPKYDPSLPQFDLDMFARTCPDPLGHVIFIEGMVWYASSSPWSLLNSPALDELYWKIIKTIRPREQTKLCHKLERMIHEEAFSLFAYQEIKLYGMRKDVAYDPYITGMMNLRDVSIAER